MNKNKEKNQNEVALNQYYRQYAPEREQRDADRNINRRRSKDYGPFPLVVNIESSTLQNNFFRQTLWTGKHMQLTLMSLKPGEDIGLELHPDVDQFLRIEEGQGMVMMGRSRDNLNLRKRVTDKNAVIVPAGTWHNLVNIGRGYLKLYSIYALPQHPFGTVHYTKEEAEKEHR